MIEYLEIWGWNLEKRFKLEVYLGVISKMLIVEIIRMYDFFDEKIVIKKIRKVGVIEEKRLEIGFF